MELSQNYISNILWLEKEAQYMVYLSDIKQLWDYTLDFKLIMEFLLVHKKFWYCSMLLAQPKAFVERNNKGNATNMV